MEAHHVLVADDEPHIGRIIKMKLEQGPFRVTLAYDGREALDLLERESDIDVVLLIPGAVKSNIANTALAAGSLVPDDSFYKPFEPQIVNRVLASQGSSSMPTIEFSRQVVDNTLRPKPPRSIMIGGSTFLWKLFAWLPKTWVLNRLWKVFLNVRK